MHLVTKLLLLLFCFCFVFVLFVLFVCLFVTKACVSCRLHKYIIHAIVNQWQAGYSYRVLMYLLHVHEMIMYDKRNDHHNEFYTAETITLLVKSFLIGLLTGYNWMPSAHRP